MSVLKAKKCMGLSLMFVLIMGTPLFLQGEESSKIFYSNGFETVNDVEFMGTGNPYIGLEQAKKEGIVAILSSGLTAEQKYSGKKSYKLEVKLNSGTGNGPIRWAHFGTTFSPRIKLNEGKNFSGRLYVASLPEGISVGIYAEVSGTDPNKKEKFYDQEPILGISSEPPDDSWIFFNKNIYESLKNRIIAKGWDPGKVYFSDWFLNISGVYKGEKVIVYIDDIKVTQ